MKFWSRYHLQALHDVGRQFRRAPGNFLLNVAVAGIALFLPVMGWTLLENLKPLADQLAVEPEISMFMRMDTPRERSAALAPDIRRVVRNAGSEARLEFVPREQALDALRNRSGLSDALTSLGQNPLPDGYILKFPGFRTDGDAAKIERIAAQLKALPGVEYVQIDSAWVKRLAALIRILNLGLAFLAAILGAVVAAVIFNTIRLQAMTQQEEIAVCRMFGATTATLRRPFLYSGALLGVLAVAAALALVAVALNPLNDAIAAFARLYAAEFRVAPLAFWQMGLLLAGGAVLGLTGALLSSERHLARME